MLAVDDPHKVVVGQRVLAQHPLELLFQLLHQFVPDLSVHQAVVRGHTGLASVEEFAERQALGGERMLAVRSTITGLFPPAPGSPGSGGGWPSP